jgi:hypothetical protein
MPPIAATAQKAQRANASPTEQYPPPAEDTFVGASQTGRCFHAPMGLDAVERVLVAAASTAKHTLRPATELDAAVGANKPVALLC